MGSAINYTSHKITAESSNVPVSLEDARIHLRMDDLTHDDLYIESLIYAVCGWVERTYSLALLTKTVEEYHSKFPDFSTSEIWLNVGPLQSVTSVKYIDSSGTEQTWGSSEYAAKVLRHTGFIIPKPDYSWPTDVAVRPDAVKITYTTGFGTGPDSVPHYIKLGVLAMVGRFYTNREDPANVKTALSDALFLPFYRFQT